MRLGLGLDLVVFDCDGVLVDSELLAMRAFRSLLDEAGVATPDSLWPQCVGLNNGDIFKLIEQTVGFAAPPELRAEVWPRGRALFEAELKPVPGVVEFLETLEARRCVASSSDGERVAVSLAVTGLARFFGEAVFSVECVAHRKPAPDIFLFAARTMGVEPKAAAVIEDSEHGVTAARAAGAKVIGFLGGAHVTSRHGDRLVAAGAQALAKTWPEVGALLAKPEAIGT